MRQVVVPRIDGLVSLDRDATVEIECHIEGSAGAKQLRRDDGFPPFNAPDRVRGVAQAAESSTFEQPSGECAVFDIRAMRS